MFSLSSYATIVLQQLQQLPMKSIELNLDKFGPLTFLCSGCYHYETLSKLSGVVVVQVVDQVIY